MNSLGGEIAIRFFLLAHLHSPNKTMPLICSATHEQTKEMWNQFWECDDRIPRVTYRTVSKADLKLILSKYDEAYLHLLNRGRTQSGRWLASQLSQFLASLWTKSNTLKPLCFQMSGAGDEDKFFSDDEEETSPSPQIRPLTSSCAKLLKRLCFHFHAVQKLFF